MNDDGSRRTGKWMFVFAWLILMAMLTYFFEQQYESINNPNNDAKTIVNNLGQKELKLLLSNSNTYNVKGKINNHPINFLVDTGATNVAVPAGMAQKLKLERGLTVIVNTAAGQVKGYMTNIKKLEIGDITLRDIRAIISPETGDDRVLLGMSALKHLEFEMSNNILILRQN